MESVSLCIEFDRWGNNLFTFAFLMTVVFSVMGCWGLIDQARKIRQNRSGKAVPITQNLVFLFMFIAYVVYGTSRGSLAMVIHGGLRAIFIVDVVYLLWKYDGFTRRNWASFGMLTGVPLTMFFAPDAYKDFLYPFFSFCGCWFSVLQPWEMWKFKTVGSASMKLVAVYLGSTVFWVAYGILSHAWPVWLPAGLYSAVYVVTIGLWWKYRVPTRALPAATVLSER